MNLKTIASIASISILGFASTIGVGAIGVRHFVGSNMANECRVASNAYIDLANTQTRDLLSMEALVKQIEENPFATFGVIGPITSLSSQIKTRWDELDTANRAYLDKCVITDDLQSFVFGGYVRELREDKRESDYQMETVRQRFVDTADRVLS